VLGPPLRDGEEPFGQVAQLFVESEVLQKADPRNTDYRASQAARSP
jgi:hypothetical protein